VTKLYFDHTFTTDQNHKFMKKLERYGFTLEPNTTEHPGAKCRFIRFNDRKYLEFASVADLSKFESAGMSFGYAGKLKTFNQTLIKRRIVTKFEHRNYDWATNSKDYLPGWNFVTFEKVGFKTMYPWITEYELRPGMKERPLHVANHANGVNHIVGHEIMVNKKGREFFQALLGKKLKDKFEFKDGITFYFHDGPKNLHKSVILKANSFNQAAKYFKQRQLVQFRGQQAIYIENPSKNERMWDLIIV